MVAEQLKTTLSETAKGSSKLHSGFVVLRNKKIVTPAIIVFSIIIVLIVLEQVFGILSVMFFGDSMIKKGVSDIKMLQKKIEREVSEYRNILDRQFQLIQKGGQYWVPSRDGNINEKFQDKITAIAKNSKVELSTTGTVILNKLGDGIVMGSLEISCSGNMEGIVKFIHALTYSTPKMYWDRFSLRPDNYNNPNIIYLAGEVKFLQLDNKEILTLFNKVQRL